MSKPPENRSPPLQQLAEQIFRDVARRFPICCVSDEFNYFPQVMGAGSDRWGWDDFSTASVEEFSDCTLQWETEMRHQQKINVTAGDQTDIRLLQGILKTLREQLREVKPQCAQPTFHLNVVIAGLTEALETADPEAWQQRIDGLPGFLRRSAALLDQVPEPFMHLGVQMLADLEQWFLQLEQGGYATGEGLSALRDFAVALKCARRVETWLLPPVLYARLVVEHLGTGDDLDEIEHELRQEYAEMNGLLTEEAGRLAPGTAWQALEPYIPFCAAPKGDLLELYRPELSRLKTHVRRAGLVPELAGTVQPVLATVPDSMSAIRASDAYSARVGYPARGGTFYLYQKARGRNRRVGRSLEYRMTAAHEAWPGHHLLDCCRWNLPRAIRRPLESPLCYEGWACFAETLLAETGYFDGPWDRFLLARRRVERAARGLIDIGMQTGRMTFATAADLLVQTGYTPRAAADVVPKYALRPGYQICYTLGLKRLLRLRDQCRHLDAGGFARRVLEQGEIGFSALRRVLQERGD